MAKIKITPLGRRVTALFLATIMCVSLVQISAFAAGETSAQQITAGGGTNYYKADGTTGTDSDYDVAVSKTIAGTDTENVFDVTTKMEYKNSSTKVTNKDAAVVLVLDTSGSMNWCAQCGKAEGVHNHTFIDNGYYDYDGNWVNKPDGYCDVCGYENNSCPLHHDFEDKNNNAICDAKDECYGRAKDHFHQFVDNQHPGKHGKMKDGSDGKCDICGESENHPLHHRFTQSRLTAAKASAEAFVNSFAQTGSVRKVAIVTFARSATKSLDWTDVNTDKSTVINKIDGLSAAGGTNTEDGMDKAADYLKDPSVNPTIANRFCVLITDGQPTFNVSQGYGNNGDSTTRYDTYGAQLGCAAVKNTGASLYAIAYGMSNDAVPVYDESAGWRNDYTRKSSITDWLKNDCGAEEAYTPSSAADLTAAFNRILQSSVTTGASGSTKLDAINDGTGTAIQFVKFNNANGATHDPSKPNEINMESVTADTSKTGFTSYTTTYQVLLNNTFSEFKPNAPYSLGAASLTFTDVNTKTSHSVSSPKPAVKGYLGGFEFQKRAGGDESGSVVFGTSQAAKANAEFTVASADGKIVKTAWTQNNLVTFLNTLPSGQAYTLKETQITYPASGEKDIFTKSDKTYTVTVSYGSTVVRDGDQVVYDSSAASHDMVFLNDYDSHKVPLTITKNWMDSEKTASRPDSIDVKLMQINGVRDGSKDAPADDAKDTLYKTVSMTGNANDSSWTADVANVPTIDSKTGDSIRYYVSEVKAEGYTAAVTSDFTLNADKTAAAATITNTRSRDTDITVSKHWVTVSGYETPVTVGLQRNDQQKESVSYELGKGQDQQHKFENVPLYHGSTVYGYVPVEIADGTLYGNSSTVTLGGHNYAVSVNGNTITNTLVQDNNMTLTGSKTWSVADYTDKNSLTATFAATGTVDGTEVAAGSTTVKYGTGTYTISGLPTYAYEVDGKWTTTASAGAAQVKEIQYTVAETSTGADGIRSIKTDNDFENRLEGTTSVTAAKVWVDSDNRHETRPDSITFDLYAGTKKIGSKVISAITQEAPKTEAAASSAEAVSSKTWDGVDLSVKFDNLDKYDAQGKSISYTVVERGTDDHNNLILDGKDTNYDVTTSANQNIDGTFAYTVTNTLNGDKTSYTVQKVWSDPLASHSTKATITLSGKAAGYNETYTKVLEGDASYTFENLPKYAKGSEITYTASETPVDGYTSHQKDFTFTNVINQSETVSVAGEKAWVNKDAVQPSETTVYLQSDVSGEMKNVTDKSAVLSGNARSYSFENLPQYAYRVGGSWTAEQPDATDNVTAVREIAYQVTDSVNGYTTTGGTKADSYNLTNTFNQQYTSLDGSKVWHVGGADLSKTTVTIGLYQDGKLFDTTTASAATDWMYSFGKNADGKDTLPLYSGYDKDNKPIAKEYYVREMNGDKPVENGGTFGEYKVTYSGSTIINSLSKIDTATTTVTAAKLWKGPQAESTTVTLTRFSNGNQDSSFRKELTLSKSDSWNTSVEKLPVLDQNGYDYTYFIAENGAAKNAEGKEVITLGDRTYDVIYSEDHLTVTNIIHQETIDKSGEKTWEETKNVPSSIQVQLYADGVSLGENFVQTVNANKDDKWIYTFKNLPKYNLSDTNSDGIIDTDGKEIQYTVREVGEKVGSYVSGNQHFNVVYNGMNIENTLVSTDTYAYRVNRIYNTYLDGNLRTPITRDGAPISLESASPVSVDTSSYPAGDEMTGYTLVGASTKKEGAADAATQTVGKDGKFSFSVTDPNVTYVVTLTYERRDTTPYVPGPVDPTPNPPVVIPVQPTPGDEKPTDPTTEIPDTETPTTEKPSTPSKPGKSTAEIADGKTPLANTPKTGDALAAWLTAAAASGAGLAWLAISAKKRKKEDAQ